MTVMDNVQKVEEPEESVRFKLLFKRLWPHFLIFNSYAFTISMLFINIIIIARIIWPSPNAFAEHAGADRPSS